MLCLENLGRPFVIPFVEDEKTLAAIKDLGGRQVDFTDESYDGGENYGSYLLQKQ